jgi:hypothetical protein
MTSTDDIAEFTVIRRQDDRRQAQNMELFDN